MVAEFADAHGHVLADWLYEQAAAQSSDPSAKAILLSRAALGARHNGTRRAPEFLLSIAEQTEPDGRALWELLRAAFADDAEATVHQARIVTKSLRLVVPRPLAGDSPIDERLAALGDELADLHPELLDETRRQAAILLAERAGCGR